MSKEKGGISVFQKYLTVWVILCMAAGILIGKFLPQIPDFLNRFEYAKVSIPMAILIWLMIYPMMMKVDFKSIKNVGKMCIRDRCTRGRHDGRFQKGDSKRYFLADE